MYKLFVLDRNTLFHIPEYKQMIIENLKKKRIEKSNGT